MLLAWAGVRLPNSPIVYRHGVPRPVILYCKMKILRPAGVIYKPNPRTSSSHKNASFGDGAVVSINRFVMATMEWVL